jgi:hypothetical protein
VKKKVLIDSGEESYFSEDNDDDDEPTASHLPDQLSNGAMSFIPRPMGLVDYDDDDDDLPPSEGALQSRLRCTDSKFKKRLLLRLSYSSES